MLLNRSLKQNVESIYTKVNFIMIVGIHLPRLSCNLQKTIHQAVILNMVNCFLTSIIREKLPILKEQLYCVS